MVQLPPLKKYEIDRTVVKLIKEALIKNILAIRCDEKNGTDTKMLVKMRYGVGGGTATGC